MTLPMMPHRFVTLTNLDMERVNDNLEAGARDVQRNLDKRYTYCGSVALPLAGVSQAGATPTAAETALMAIAIHRPSTNAAVEVCGVELVLYGNAAVTATLACSDTTWPSLTLATSSTTTTEASAFSGVPVPVPSSSADVTFTLSFSGAFTVTAGYIRLYLRCDRGAQGVSHAGYTPTLINSASSTAGSLLDTELTALATAVSTDTANDADLRCELFSVRGLAAGASAVLRLPSGARRKLASHIYIVAAATETLTVDIDGETTTKAGAGVTLRSFKSLPITGTTSDAPMTAASDTVVTLSDAGVATVLLAYVLIWWS